LRMAGDLYGYPPWLVWQAAASETSFLGMSGISSFPVIGKSVLTEGLAGALYQVGGEAQLAACCRLDRLDVPRSRYVKVTALG
jgi:hypothetical protein